ncbi:MAG: anthranilate phosphoribosyltransferase [Acidobacteriota bacterium]|nr:anthranilate phosphoribosyltransferase [Acidobacteriota bacterium]
MTLDLLHAVVDGGSLTEEQAEMAMRALLAGESSAVLTAAFLTALRVKGETVEELTGFARAMRAVATPLLIAEDSRPVLDTCGTGGNGTTTFNISTVSAFVVAGAGVRVAKHGNRSITSRCGSADVLEALGVRTQAGPEAVARAIRDVGIGFLFAPAFHSAVRHVQPVRLELKFRTAFNYLGPLTNPARAEMQVSGTWSDSAAEKIAGAMARLGLERGYVVHGSDGLGEVTITGPSTVFEVRGGLVTRSTVTPEDFGLRVQSGASLQGGDAEQNRAMADAVFGGERGAPRDIVLLNSALALMAAGKASGYKEGVGLAAESIDSGAAGRKLIELRSV